MVGFSRRIRSTTSFCRLRWVFVLRDHVRQRPPARPADTATDRRPGLAKLDIAFSRAARGPAGSCSRSYLASASACVAPVTTDTPGMMRNMSGVRPYAAARARMSATKARPSASVLRGGEDHLPGAGRQGAGQPRRSRPARSPGGPCTGRGALSGAADLEMRPLMVQPVHLADVGTRFRAALS